ncbi:hypothetical protein NDR87_12250 [Nocardia sp. CDC159]|uniref:Uncharacterized protein n=1 Tax=Nocardia pulmonis TaxID=2951408 RepID=A0A9X2E5L7_9NOCA|nr:MULTISPECIES: hypothetical protein [Nocardia]MCM6774244.1 hypothetical protein [Nocardia pulmonis]MCM6787131.1 hypothetical protein [Nocardia sp. CDC159]
MTIERPPPHVNPPPEFGAAAGPLGIPAAVLGLVLFLGEVVALPRLAHWAAEYGAVLVYLAFGIYTAVVGTLVWWGVDTEADRRARAGRKRAAARSRR